MDEALPGAKPEWFEEWFDHDYLLVYGHRDARDAALGVGLLARALALPAGAAVLDLACGPGRHAAEMAAIGLDPVGLDLSAVLLGEARRRLGITPGAAGAAVPFVRADMRSLPFRDAAFDAVASFFTSFGYFDDAGNRLVLAEAARVLGPGGALLLDVPNRDATLARLAPETRRNLGSIFVLEARRWDAASGRLVKDIEIQDASDTRKRTESVRLYAPEEIAAMLALAGLAPGERFGDYQGEPFDPGRSPRLVVVGRKRAGSLRECEP